MELLGEKGKGTSGTYPKNVLEKGAKTEIYNVSLSCSQILGPSVLPLSYLRSHYEQDFYLLQCCFDLGLLETLFTLISLE